MTEEGFTSLFGILDQVWGGVDADREQGYRWVLEEYDDAVVAEVVRGLSKEDRPWLPKAPEIAARCEHVNRRCRNEERMRSLTERMARRLGSGRTA